MSTEIENIALFDMDGVFCNYDESMDRYLKEIANPTSPHYVRTRDREPEYIRRRIKLIRNQPGWWRNLKPYAPGFEILKIARDLDFMIYILTKATREAPNSYTEKVLWIEENVPNPEELRIIEAEDKSVVYGKVFVEDYPKNIQRWVKWRKRGLVIMPVQDWNKNFKHPQVIPYNGKNLEEIRIAMTKAKNRLPGEKL